MAAARARHSDGGNGSSATKAVIALALVKMIQSYWLQLAAAWRKGLMSGGGAIPMVGSSMTCAPSFRKGAASSSA